MAITLRGTKGSALTHSELDANFTTLEAADAALAATDVTLAAADAALAATDVTLAAADAAHAALTIAHGATGAVVGTTNTQTLTNKTIVVASNTITTAPSGALAATELNSALAELQGDIDTRATSAALTAHIDDTTASHAASAIANTPAGSIAATTVQAAIDELASEKQPLDATLTGVAEYAAPWLTASFSAATDYAVWQGVCWWSGASAVIATSDRDAVFALSNTITVYSVTGKVLFTLPSAYTGTDPAGKKMSFGSPAVIDGFLYVPVYNINDGGSPLISRVCRYTLNATTYAVALDTTFGDLSGAQSIGAGTAEHVAYVGGEWLVCYHDQTFISRFNSAWSLLGTMPLSQAFPSDGGAQAMIWEDADTTCYIIMHGPNVFGSTKSNIIHKYTRSGNTLTYISTLVTPGYGLSQGASAGPLGYVWADRPGNRVWFTPDLVDCPLRAHSPISEQVDLYKPTLLNSWVAFDATYDRTAKVYYDKNTGRVWLEGMIKNGTTTPNTTLFQVPAHLAPKYSKNFAVVSNDLFGSVGVVGNNQPDPSGIGNVIVRVGSNVWLSLDGVSWQVDDQ